MSNTVFAGVSCQGGILRVGSAANREQDHALAAIPCMAHATGEQRLTLSPRQADVRIGGGAGPGPAAFSLKIRQLHAQASRHTIRHRDGAH